MGVVTDVSPMATIAIRHFEWQKAYGTCTLYNRSCWLQMAEQAADSRIIFSSYVENLEETAKVRYNEKLAMLGGAQDPYLLTHQVPRRVCWVV